MPSFLVKISTGLYVHYNPLKNAYFIGKRVGACVFYEQDARRFIASLAPPGAWHMEQLPGDLRHFSVTEASGDPVMRDMLINENIIKKT
jgi:hypothetical protein